MVYGTGSETIKFEERVVDYGKGDEVVDVVVLGRDAGFVALEGV
jgi:hypothetical protein